MVTQSDIDHQPSDADTVLFLGDYERNPDQEVYVYVSLSMNEERC